MLFVKKLMKNSNRIPTKLLAGKVFYSNQNKTSFIFIIALRAFFATFRGHFLCGDSSYNQDRKQWNFGLGWTSFWKICQTSWTRQLLAQKALSILIRKRDGLFEKYYQAHQVLSNVCGLSAKPKQEPI